MTHIFPTILNPNTGALLLRITFGGVLLAHGVYLKLIIFSLAGTAAFFGSIGLPEFLAYVVFFIEAVAGTAIVLGIYTQLFSLLTVPVLLGATWAHSANGWVFSNAGGGWEFPFTLVLMAIIVACVGNGKYVLSSRFSTQDNK